MSHRRDYSASLVYVTGGSSGIGLATATAFALAGASVRLLARNTEKLKAAVASIRQVANAAGQSSSKESAISYASLDVSNPESVEAALSRSFEETGAPDILVNSAGVSRPGYFEQLDSSIMRSTINTNLLGSMYVCSSVYKAMLGAAVHGSIVNVSSLAGLVGVFGYTVYGASKFGIIGFSEALRSEAAVHGIRVSVLCPPDTDTPQLHEENAFKPPETKAIAGNARILKPDQVASALLRGLEGNKFLIFPDYTSSLIYAAHRFVPSLVRAMMQNDVARVRHRQN